MPGSYASYMPAHKAASADWLLRTDSKDLLVRADFLSSLSPRSHACKKRFGQTYGNLNLGRMIGSFSSSHKKSNPH